MSENLAERSKNKLAKIYAVGIAAFIAIFGFITLLAIFLTNLK